MTPETKYVRSGHTHIAYQTIGDGPLDLIYVPGWVSHVELAWEEPTLARFLMRLASFSRLITFDKRGTGLSDRVPLDNLPTLEERMDDLKAVMDAVGSERAAVFGFSEGGVLCALFAATYPERTIALAICGAYAKRIWSEDYQWAPTTNSREEEYKMIEAEWGKGMDVSHYIPSKADDQEFKDRLATYFRRSASPSAAVALLRMNTQADIRHILPTIRVPTLVLQRIGDRDVNIEEGRWIASQISNAKFVELTGEDHIPWVGDQDEVLDEIQEFLTGVRPVADFDRVLATVLFTDIVGSTEILVRLGDKEYRRVLDKHNKVIRAKINLFNGQEIDTTGDGFLIAFDGPGRAIRCAQAIIDAVKDLGLDIRVGAHTGEVHKIGSEMTGITVHITARIMDLAGPGEIIVSNSLKDLVAGMGIEFKKHGDHKLKGIPDLWELYTVNSGQVFPSTSES